MSNKPPIRNTGATETEKKELSVEEEIAAKIAAKSKGMRPELATGAAQMYDLRNYEGDYTAGGQLTARFVNKDDSRIAMMRNKGYDFPSEWSSQLKDLTVGSQVLMLRPKGLEETYQRTRRQLSNEIAGKSKMQDSPAWSDVAPHAFDVAHTQQDIHIPEEVIVAD